MPCYNLPRLHAAGVEFVHGDVFALTGLFASSLIANRFHLDTTSGALTITFGLLAVFLIAMAFGAIVNASIEFVAYRRLRNAPRPLNEAGRTATPLPGRRGFRRATRAAGCPTPSAPWS